MQTEVLLLKIIKTQKHNTYAKLTEPRPRKTYTIDKNERINKIFITDRTVLNVCFISHKNLKLYFLNKLNKNIFFLYFHGLNYPERAFINYPIVQASLLALSVFIDKDRLINLNAFKTEKATKYNKVLSL